MATHPFLEALEAIAESVRAHPLLELVAWRKAKPLAARARKAVEETMGKPLPEVLAELYGQANGVALHWSFKRDLSEAQEAEIEQRYDDYAYEPPYDEALPFARINLIPLEKSIARTNWLKVIQPFVEPAAAVRVGRRNVPESEFVGWLRPFDLYSEDSCMAFVLQPESDLLRVVQLSDGYQDWRSSHATDFTSYLRFLERTCGIVEARDELFYNDTERPGKLLAWDKNYPALVKRTPKLFRSQAATGR